MGLWISWYYGPPRFAGPFEAPYGPVPVPDLLPGPVCGLSHYHARSVREGGFALKRGRDSTSATVTRGTQAMFDFDALAALMAEAGLPMEVNTPGEGMSDREIWTMTPAEFDIRRLSDQRLGWMFRDWLAVQGPESAHPSPERIQQYAGRAREILGGAPAGVSADEFARFIRLRLSAGARGLDLAAVRRWFEAGGDCPDIHREVVLRAIADGQPVPEEVLRAYADLFALYGSCTVPEGKADWELTRVQFCEAKRLRDVSRGHKTANRWEATRFLREVPDGPVIQVGEHEMLIREALAECHPVPDHVLAEYPHLPRPQVVQDGAEAVEDGAYGYCWVTVGPKDVPQVLKANDRQVRDFNGKFCARGTTMFVLANCWPHRREVPDHLYELDPTAKVWRLFTAAEVSDHAEAFLQANPSGELSVAIEMAEQLELHRPLSKRMIVTAIVKPALGKTERGVDKVIKAHLWLTHDGWALSCKAHPDSRRVGSEDPPWEFSFKRLAEAPAPRKLIEVLRERAIAANRALGLEDSYGL